MGEVFSGCGKIERVHLPMADGRHQGIAFIAFADHSGVAAALKYHGIEYDGGVINVGIAKLAKAKPKLGNKAKSPSSDEDSSDWSTDLSVPEMHAKTKVVAMKELV